MKPDQPRLLWPARRGTVKLADPSHRLWRATKQQVGARQAKKLRREARRD